jgi:hypothetical protein
VVIFPPNGSEEYTLWCRSLGLDPAGAPFTTKDPRLWVGHFFRCDIRIRTHPDGSLQYEGLVKESVYAYGRNSIRSGGKPLPAATRGQIVESDLYRTDTLRDQRKRARTQAELDIEGVSQLLDAHFLSSAQLFTLPLVVVVFRCRG